MMEQTGLDLSVSKLDIS